MKKNNIKTILILHCCLFLFSLSNVCSKQASSYDFLSGKFIIFYSLTILILGIYAIAWQQIIKRMPLSLAFANKAITVVWGLIWGLILFNENITIGKIIGVILLVTGIILYSLADKENIHE